MNSVNAKKNLPLSAAILAVLGSAVAAPAMAQQTTVATELTEVVVTGTRKEGVSPTETLSPVDLVGGEDIVEQAAFDLTESLSKISPSLNTQRFPIADGTALIRPVTLRNLSPDHTLVLVNGTRRHRSALVNLQLAPLGTTNQGSQGVDWSTFPAAAIKRVEILRDGASAQYGSDAIAGVVNVILKDASDGLSLDAQAGSYSEGDGDRLSVSANAGFPLTDDGFINVTVEYSTSEITWRGNARPDAAAVEDFVGPGIVPLRGLGQRWGDPDVEAAKALVNFGVGLTDTVELFGFASYMDNTTVSDFFYRAPVLPAEAEIAARGTLQVDVNGDFIPDAAPQSLIDSIIGQGLSPADYLMPDTFGQGSSGWVLRNPIYTEFPGGYNPNFGADITDMAAVLGVRGQVSETLSWNLRGRYEENEVDYVVSETINPSLGRLSPLSFKPGKLTQEESGVNLDFVKTFTSSPLSLAFGAELRNETYQISAGDEASIVAGPTAAFFGVGSDGFQGFPEESAGSFESDSWAAYVDAETDLTDKLSAAFAFRYEDFVEFGDTFDWKVSGRYQFTDSFAVRATYNTGFRAPTPGQVNTLNVTTTSDSTGALIPNGTYPVNSPVAIALGAVPLVPEESENYTLGVVWQPSDIWSLTADYYHIEIVDRLALLNNTIGASEVLLLQQAGIPNAALLLGSNANYFVNGFDSEINGFDVAVTADFDVTGGSLVADLRYNHNEQTVSSVAPGTINASRVYDLENQVPEDSAVLSLNYSTSGGFRGLVRLNSYGGWSTTGGLFSPGDASDRYSYGGKVLVDLEASYTFAKHYTVTIGGDNVFDTTPGEEKEPVSRFLGVDQAMTSPFGFNGAFYYLRVGVDF